MYSGSMIPKKINNLGKNLDACVIVKQLMQIKINIVILVLSGTFQEISISMHNE